MAGFEGSKVWEAIKEQTKNAFLSASHVLPGGEKATGGDWLMAGLLAYGGIKAGKGLGIGKLFSNIKGGKGAATVLSGAGRKVSQADEYVAFWQNAKLWNTTTRESAINASKTTKTLGGIGSTFDDISVKVAPYVAKLSPKISKAGKFLKGNGLSLLFSVLAIAQAENKVKETVVQSGGFAASLAGGSLGAKAGAAIGTAIVPGAGTAVGAAIGGAVGGIGGYIGGEKFLRWVTEQTEPMKQFFSQTWSDIKEEGAKASQWIGEKWNIAKSKIEGVWIDVGAWFQSTVWGPLEKGVGSIKEGIEQKWQAAKEKVCSIWNDVSNWFENTVWTPIYDFAVSAVNILVGFWEIGKQGVMKAWKTVSSWFQDTIWNPIKEKAKEISEKAIEIWNTAKSNLYDAWKSVSNWFESNVWSPIKEFVKTTQNWIEEKFQNAKSIFIKIWNDVSSWFYKTVSLPIQSFITMAGDWISAKFEAAKEKICSIWSDASNWFENIVWTPIKNGVSAAGSWIKEKLNEAKSLMISAWKTVSGWFEENVWGPIKNGASSVYNWVSEKLSAVGTWFGKIGDIGGEKTGLKTSEGTTTVFDSSTKNIDKNAMGGFVNQAHLGIVGEAGPEAIIPLSGTNKHRGISLWQETGKMLGMLPKHANGGIFGGNVNYKELLERSRKNQNQEGFSKGITIHLGGMNFTFTGAGSADKEGILTVIRQQMPDIANEVAETIAKELQKLLLNMKTNIA